MKVILVPTDFSKTATNAINYAVEIAKLIRAKLILFHAFHVPVVATEVPIALPSLNELEKDCMEGLKKIQTSIQLNQGVALSIECVCKCGFAVDEINLYTKENKVDLIVMGMQGGGFITEKIIGSITTALLRESKCAVLAIDQKVRFRTPKKIVLACDYMETDNQTVLAPLKEMVNLFKSHVYVLNVIHELECVPSIPKAVSEFINLEDSLGDVDHSLHYLREESIVDGINDFVSERKMDMVVMIPRKHSFLKRVFQEPNTKRMAFHTNVPLLALH
ncbi:MAG TPA: universal stress protein [Bacteroidia bacterium]|jgi:nucleotide-binding universal stress UspA family protein|nr:universal stress protein [Bacteroidia bacterium]